MFPLQDFSDEKLILDDTEYTILLRRRGINSRTILELSKEGKLFYLAVYDNKEHLSLLLEAFADGTTIPVLSQLENKVVEAIVFGDYIEEVTGLKVDA